MVGMAAVPRGRAATRSLSASLRQPATATLSRREPPPTPAPTPAPVYYVALSSGTDPCNAKNNYTGNQA